jgi:hypothetical protein
MAHISRWAGSRIAVLATLAATLGALALALAPPAALAAGGYHSPGYKGTKKLPKVTPVPPPPPAILGPGSLPHVLVDAAGTGHIAWTAGGQTTESVFRYCRLPRGQRTCAASSSLIPPDNDSASGNGPQTDIDFEGPIPLSIGNELLVLDHRCCNSVPLPDGSSSSDVNFLYTSEDGGATFTGPGIVGTQTPSGNAIVYGGNSPAIGVISDTETGGTFFQGSSAFTEATANLGNLGPNEAYDGRLALDGTRPVAAFTDLSGRIFIREYTGTGDVNDVANWSVSQTQGYNARLVGGTKGVWLAYQTGLTSGAWMVRPVSGGVATGTPVQVVPAGTDTGYFTFDEGPSGELIAGWVNRDVTDNEIHIRTSTNGVQWTADSVLAASGSDSHLAVAAAPDGGGYAVFQQSTTSGEAQIAVAPFGTHKANGKKGLGNLDGEGAGGLGGDAYASASCTDVHFGVIDALAEEGCFLRDPAHPNSGAAVTGGEIRLNGLEVIPDPGVNIVIDPRQHTIDTTGSVSVNLRAPGIGDITLYHGELHISLPGKLAGLGQTLFDFDTSKFAAVLEGFPIEGKIDVQLAKDAVKIPISLKLPPYMGGISGAATLLADNTNGLQLTSLHIGVDDLVLGALEVKQLSITYTESGDVWKGSAKLNIPAGTPYFGIDVMVEFDHGDFTMGSFSVFLPFPGVPIFTDAYLAGFGGGFDIHPPKKKFFGSVTVGAIPLDPPNYAITVKGTVSITFVDNGPVILEVDGVGAVHGFEIANAKLVFQTNGYFEVDGGVDIDLDVAELKASVSAFVDLPGKEFSSQIQGELLVFDHDIASADAVISSTGAAACGEAVGFHMGFGYHWGGSAELIGPGLGSCDISGYVVHPVSNEAKDGRAHVAAAGVQVTGGAPFEDIAVTGTGTAPSVVLTNPGGQPIVPVSIDAPGAAGAPAVAVADAKNATTYVMLNKPAAGNWSVSAAAGSSAITAVQSARGYPNPVAHGSVSGSGHKRTLHYTVPSQPGLSVSFAEKATGVYKLLGAAHGGRGTLRFAPADGPGGSRVIDAILTENGVPSQTVAVAHYTAPPPAVPARVKHLTVKVRGASFRISFGGVTGANRYRIAIAGSDGRHFVKLTTARTTTVPAIGYSDRVTVTVAGVTKSARTGKLAKANATYTSHVQLCASLPRKQRKRHHC